jgi:hypothetical protein
LLLLAERLQEDSRTLGYNSFTYGKEEVEREGLAD